MLTTHSINAKILVHGLTRNTLFVSSLIIEQNTIYFVTEIMVVFCFQTDQLRVSYCDQPLSVVHRCGLSVVCRSSTFLLKHQL